MGLDRGTVLLEEHNRNWENEYLKEKNLLEKHLSDYADNIQHVGSTSISELKAKPIIDIAVSLKDWNKREKIFKILENIGYEYRPNAGTADRIFFAKGTEKNRTHYLHICRWKSQDWFNLIDFRDCLNQNRSLQIQYQTLKEKLALKYPNNRNKYCDGKSDFIKSVIQMKQSK